MRRHSNCFNKQYACQLAGFDPSGCSLTRRHRPRLGDRLDPSGKIFAFAATILRTLRISCGRHSHMTRQLRLTPTALAAQTGAEPAFLALVRTFGLLRRVMEPYFGGFGLSGAQWGVLRTLHRETVESDAKSLRLTDLGDRLL